MAPFFGDGDILPTRLVRKSDSLKVGDVIVFRKNGVLVCHEIVKIDDSGSQVKYITKGMNPETNQEVDRGSITRNNIVEIADFSEEFATKFEQLRTQGSLPYVSALGMSNQFDKLNEKHQHLKDLINNFDENNKDQALESVLDIMIEICSNDFTGDRNQDKFNQLRVKDLSACMDFITENLLTGYSAILFEQMFKKVFGSLVYASNSRNINLDINELKVLSEIIRSLDEFYTIEGLIKELNKKVYSFRFKNPSIKLDYINDLINKIWENSYDNLLVECLRSNDYWSENLLNGLKNIQGMEINGRKVLFSEDKIIGIVKEDNRIIWLELGSEKTGLIHIWKGHMKNQFENWGIKNLKDLANLLLKTVKNYEPYNIDIKKDRYYYSIEFNGKIRSLMIGISLNGFINTAMPLSN